MKSANQCLRALLALFFLLLSAAIFIYAGGIFMPNNLIFFISSVGDTDLATKTIEELRLQQKNTTFYLIPLTKTAEDRIQDLKNANTPIIIQPVENLLDKDHKNFLAMNHYITSENIAVAYVGVSSNNATLPYEIVQHLNIPCIVVNEYMYKDPEHAFWQNVESLSKKENLQFAVPLPQAKNEIELLSKNAKTSIIGHLAIDNAMKHSTVSAQNALAIRKRLEINDECEYVFVSGTSQPIGIDSAFVDTLLKELSTKQYPHLSLRFGIHPGIAQKEEYLNDLLAVCEKYPSLSSQFKIILPENIENQLGDFTHQKSAFLCRVNMTGSEASSVAERVAQAAPGALLNTAVLLGLPAYFPCEKNKAYLPGFSKTIVDFFTAKPTEPKTYEDLGLQKENAGYSLAKRLTDY